MSKNINNIPKTSNIPIKCLERYLRLDGKSAHPLRSNGVYFSGVSNLCGGYQVGDPVPSTRHMVIITKNGEGYLRTRTDEFNLTENTIIAVPPGNSCLFGVTDDHWDIMWFYMMDISHWGQLLRRGITFRNTSLTMKIESVMVGYLSETTADRNGERAAELFADLIVLYLEEALGILDTDDDFDEIKPKLDALWRNVYDNPGKKWSKNDMAAEIHVSLSTFDRLTRRYYGVTPWSKVIQIRMRHAEALLIKTDYPIQLIAERLGYANEFAFSTAFKLYSGSSPKYFRKRT